MSDIRQIVYVIVQEYCDGTGSLESVHATLAGAVAAVEANAAEQLADSGSIYERVPDVGAPYLWRCRKHGQWLTIEDRAVLP